MKEFSLKILLIAFGLYLHCPLSAFTYEQDSVRYEIDPTSKTAMVIGAVTGAKHLTIPNHLTIGQKIEVTAIKSKAFYTNNHIEIVQLPDNIISIGSSAFLECSKLKSINLPKALIELGFYAFRGCGLLRDIGTIPPFITVIPSKCFSGCRFKIINIPDNITTIEYEVFYQVGNEKLKTKKIILGKGLQKIQRFAFINDSIRQIYIKNPTPPVITEDFSVFESVIYSYATLYVPKGSLDVYKNALTWRKFKKIIEMDVADMDNLDAASKDSFKDILSNYKQQLNNDVAKATRVADSINNLKERSKALGDSINRLKNKKEQLVQQLDKVDLTMVEKIAIAQELGKIDSLIENLKEKKAEIDSVIKEASNKLDAINNKINDLKQKVNLISNAIDNANYGDEATIQASLDNLKVELDKLTENINNLDVSIKPIEDKIIAAEVLADKTNLEIDKISKEISDKAATGIDRVTSKKTIVEIYSVDGRKLEKLVRGFNIVKYKDGTIEKQVLK